MILSGYTRFESTFSSPANEFQTSSSISAPPSAHIITADLHEWEDIELGSISKPQEPVLPHATESLHAMAVALLHAKGRPDATDGLGLWEGLGVWIDSSMRAEFQRPRSLPRSESASLASSYRLYFNLTGTEVWLFDLVGLDLPSDFTSKFSQRCARETAASVARATVR
jgi:hypothetical protein